MKRKPYKLIDENKVAERIYKTKIHGLYFVEHAVFEDERGFYAEMSIVPDLEEVIGREFRIKQVNMARSKTNVIRGMHVENWSKLVSVTGPKVFCALADVREGFATFSQVEVFWLGEAEGCLQGSLFIDRGIANSLCVTDGPIDYLYCVDELYRERDRNRDKPISLFDPKLAIDWPIKKSEMVVSARDVQGLDLHKWISQVR